MEGTLLDEDVEALVTDRTRGRIWEMASKITRANPDLINDGAAGCTCFVLDKYTIDFLDNLPDDERAARIVMRDVRKNMPVIAAVCVSLVAKMMTAYAPNLKIVQKYLRSRGNNFTLSELIKMELEVFQRNGFKLPLFTNVQQSQMLAQDLNCEEQTVQITGMIMDVTEVNLVAVKKNLNQRRRFHAAKSNTIYPRLVMKWRHLIAATVVTGWAFKNKIRHSIPHVDLVTRASLWARIDSHDLLRIAETVLAVVMAGVTGQTSTATRRPLDTDDVPPPSKKPKIKN